MGEVPVNFLELFDYGTGFFLVGCGWGVLLGFFCSLLEFQVHSDGKCQLWYIFLSSEEPNKTAKDLH